MGCVCLSTGETRGETGYQRDWGVLASCQRGGYVEMSVSGSVPATGVAAAEAAVLHRTEVNRNT